MTISIMSSRLLFHACMSQTRFVDKIFSITGSSPGYQRTSISKQGNDFLTVQACFYGT